MEERARGEDGQAGGASHEPLSHADKFCSLSWEQWEPVEI